MPQCKLDVTLEPLSAAYLNQVERLWSDPAVIRYTSIRTPCIPGSRSREAKQSVGTAYGICRTARGENFAAWRDVCR